MRTDKKRRPDPEQRRRDMREKALREFSGLFDLYWSMCGSWCACAGSDAELQRRMLDTRAHVIALVCAMMPLPGAGQDDEDKMITDGQAALVIPYGGEVAYGEAKTMPGLRSPS